MSLASGTRLGPYEIVSQLGQGGMGEVYRARDTRLDRAVALKVLPPHLAEDPTARARFDREARAIAGLNHPNVCALFDVGSDAGQNYLVMELLEGMTLQERLLRGALDVPQLVELSLALADALDAAHGQGLIHRDLKPANIFITSRGVPKILDFGLAKALDPGDDATRQSDATLTGLGTTIGTVAYMSPEQLRGEPLDARTDLFSFGLVLYEMATGQRAFSGATSAVVSAGILGQEAPAPRTLRPELPAKFEDAILKAMEKDRALRCQSAAELRADLMRIRREGSDPARSVVTTAPTAVMATAPAAQLPATGVPPSASTRAASASPMLVIAGLVLLTGVSFGGWYWYSHSSTSPTLEPTSAIPPAPSPAAAPSTSGGTPPPPVTAQPKVEAAPPKAEAPATQVVAGNKPAATPSPTTAAPPPTTPTSSAITTDVSGARSAVRPGPGPGPGRVGRAGRGLLGPAGQNLITRLRTMPSQPFHILFAAGSPEAQETAKQLQGLLTAGGWTSSGVQQTQAATAGQLGIGAPQRTPAIMTVVNWATSAGLNPEFRAFPRLKEVQIMVGAPK